MRVQIDGLCGYGWENKLMRESFPCINDVQSNAESVGYALLLFESLVTSHVHADRMDVTVPGPA
ncbi:hypothetical protein SBI_06438 [Streptomyces bingchenggensis BCW-1]|uniref:Uncharacterized protein n=1 Tax=Streptomyces bingchenggensis (strain BCW-1) TaxID=749414 RepID=D7BTY9_STRBB|nr:hypothetical protein SBI_06438 [Streptomyces bingchenggensis BCW-1]